MECETEVRINGTAERVFAVLVGLARYPDWLPPSETFVRIGLALDEPIRAGSTYIDYQTHGIEFPGEVHICEPPRRIGFRQQKKLPFGAEISTQMEYTLEAGEADTRVVRHQVFTMPWLLRPMELIAKGKILKENRRILNALKRAVEPDAEITK